MIKAGRMDRLIVFQRDSGNTTDTIGHPVQNFTTLRSEYAEVQHVAGSEVFKSAKDVAVRTATFRCHWFSGLLASDRISYDGAYWDILYIREINRRELIEVLAQVTA